MHLFWGKLPSVAYFHIDFSFPFLNLGQSIDVNLSFVKIQDEASFYLTALIEECNRCSTFQNLTANKSSLNQVRDSVSIFMVYAPDLEISGLAAILF